jgi:hypothetical protein
MLNTKKPVGSNFSSELKAAGLLGLPFSWGEDGQLTFGEDMSEQQITAVEAVLAAHVAVLPSAAELQAKQLEQSLTQAVQHHLDATAQSLGYDDIRSAATYADEPAVANFQSEGKALRAWRSLLWAAAYAKMQRVKTGLEPLPTSEVLIASLPAFTPP